MKDYNHIRSEADAGGPVAAIGRLTNRLALSPLEAAERLGLSLDTFDRHVRRHLPEIKVGRRILIPVSALEAWVEQAGEGLPS